MHTSDRTEGYTTLFVWETAFDNSLSEAGSAVLEAGEVYLHAGGVRRSLHPDVRAILATVEYRHASDSEGPEGAIDNAGAYGPELVHFTLKGLELLGLKEHASALREIAKPYSAFYEGSERIRREMSDEDLDAKAEKYRREGDHDSFYELQTEHLTEFFRRVREQLTPPSRMTLETSRRLSQAFRQLRLSQTQAIDRARQFEIPESSLIWQQCQMSETPSDWDNPIDWAVLGWLKSTPLVRLAPREEVVPHNEAEARRVTDIMPW